jgi:surfactin synthase thioesterase subunit
MRALFVQDLRDDLALVAAHRHSGLLPHADIDVWLAADDPLVGPDDADEWRSASHRTVRIRRFPGEHLFIFRTASPASVWQALTATVAGQRA